jgi:N-acetylneuraminate lyase
MTQRLTGLIAAPHTPMHPDGRLKLEVIEKQAEFLARNRVTGAFVCGSTGESMSLTVPERMEVAARWCKAAPGDFPVIVHVGHTCLADCKALAAHAQESGASAIAAMAPFFFKPGAVEDLVSFCVEVAAAAPGLPFYYYHIPSLTGVGFAMFDFLSVAARRIPTLAGIKFTHEDLIDYGRCVDFEDGRFDVLFGRDECLLAGLALGATGGVGSTYNFAAPVYLRIIGAFRAGRMDEARRDQARAREMVVVFIRFGGLVAGKAMMKLVGLDCGPVRPPLSNLTPEQFDAMRVELDRIGFFSFCSK